MTNKENIIATLKIHKPELSKLGVQNIGLFGSYLRNEHSEKSDIDLLIEPEKGFTIFQMLKLEEEISELIKHKVDLVEYSALKPSIKEDVLLSAITIL